MVNNDFFRGLSGRLSALLPMAEELREELRTKIEQQVKRSFAELDVLSREEFDQQARALGRAETRIAELEKLLQQLEAQLNSIDPASSDG
jgi:BMFP domain-containing protein YqiC